MGVRGNDTDVVDVVRRAVAPQRVDGVDVFPNLSLVVEPEPEGGPVRPLHRLHRRGPTVLRTRSVGRLVRAALRHLEGFVHAPPGLVALRTQTWFGPAGAVLVDDAVVRYELNERRVARLGWTGTDGAPAFLDPATAEVVVPEPRVALDPAVLAEIDARWPPADTEPPVAPGRYPIRAALLTGAGGDPWVDRSPAGRWAALAALVDTTVWPRRAADVAGVGALDGRIEVRQVTGVDPAEVVDALRDLAGRPPARWSGGARR